jgi:hypothetical protein
VTVKTTFDLPEPLLREVQRIAKQRGTTAKAVVQQALARVVEEENVNPEPFILSDASVNGWRSMTPEAQKLSMHELILLSHEGRP